MQQRYQQAFAKLQNNKQKAFIPFTMLGWPDAERCLATIKLMIDGGATALELGIAFSDPVADGPVIQQAAVETLDSVFSVENAFELIRAVRGYNQHIPIGILCYYNVVLSGGAAK